MSPTTFSLLGNATLETLYMILLSGLLACFIGLPFGILLFATRPGHLLPHPFLNRMLSSLVNIMRSIPFIILMVAVVPLTRFIVGTSIGTTAAIVPLTVCAIPFFARIVESTLLEINKGLIEAALSMGATHIQIIWKVLIPEALPGIIQGITLTAVNLVSYSAMAGAVGGGGLGDLAIRYGYQRFDIPIMILTIAIMIILVQALQWIGDSLTHTLLKSR